MRSRTQNAPDRLTIETSRLVATIATRGYVSGVASLLDRATGAQDKGFGLDIVDFLLEPIALDGVVPEGQYTFGPDDPLHGNIPKRYVEGPQICTQAENLPVELLAGDGFVAVRQRYRWHESYPPRDQAGSIWEQTLIFPEGERFFLASDRVTTVSSSPALILRIDLPGHIKHDQGDRFEHVYLSYGETPYIPSTEFQRNFPPDARFRYSRPEDGSPPPKRFIRAYQVRMPDAADGPWLGGITLDPADVHEAWCHQRGYVCMIQEIGGRPAVPGATFGACYAIGWFDDIAQMEATCDRLGQFSGIELEGPRDRPTGYRLVARGQLAAVSGWDEPAGE